METFSSSSCFICRCPASMEVAFHGLEEGYAMKFLCEFFKLPIISDTEDSMGSVKNCEFCCRCEEQLSEAIYTLDQIRTLEVKVSKIRRELQKCVQSSYSRSCNIPIQVDCSQAEKFGRFITQCWSECRVMLVSLPPEHISVKLEMERQAARTKRRTSHYDDYSGNETECIDSYPPSPIPEEFCEVNFYENKDKESTTGPVKLKRRRRKGKKVIPSWDDVPQDEVDYVDSFPSLHFQSCQATDNDESSSQHGIVKRRLRRTVKQAPVDYTLENDEIECLGTVPAPSDGAKNSSLASSDGIVKRKRGRPPKKSLTTDHMPESSVPVENSGATDKVAVVDGDLVTESGEKEDDNDSHEDCPKEPIDLDYEESDEVIESDNDEADEEFNPRGTSRPRGGARKRGRKPKDELSEEKAKTYSCRHCDQVYSLRKELRKHLLKVHGDDVLSKCNFCDLDFAKNCRVEKEGKDGESSEISYVCGIDQCTRSYKTVAELRRHHQAKCGENPKVKEVRYGNKLSCHVCGKVYLASNALRYHIANVHEKSFRFCCEICGKGFQVQSHLRNHITFVHSTEKRFECEICHMKFKRPHQVFYHRRTHTGERPFTCEFCGKGFAVREKLKLHRDSLHGTDSFPCSICGKPFRSKHYLHNHVMTTHYGSRKNRYKNKKAAESGGGAGTESALERESTENTKEVANVVPALSQAPPVPLPTEKQEMSSQNFNDQPPPFLVPTPSGFGSLGFQLPQQHLEELQRLGEPPFLHQPYFRIGGSLPML